MNLLYTQVCSDSTTGDQTNAGLIRFETEEEVLLIKKRDWKVHTNTPVEMYT